MSKSWLELLKKSSTEDNTDINQPKDAGWMRMLKETSTQSQPKRNSPEGHKLRLFPEFVKLQTKHLLVAVASFFVCLFIAYDLQDPVPKHPEVDGWGELKLGMPFVNAQNVLKSICADFNHIDKDSASDCGVFRGGALNVYISKANKYLFWNYLDGVSLRYDGLGHNDFVFFYRQLEKKYGKPNLGSDCLNRPNEDCLTHFANSSVWLDKSSYKDWKLVKISYYRAWD